MIRGICQGLKVTSFIGALAAIATLHTEFVHAAGKNQHERHTTVLERTRLGSYIEETAVVPHGRFGADVAMVTGYEVYGVALRGQGHAKKMKKLFDIRELGLGVTPKGMAYLESENLFVFIDAVQPTKLLLTDDRGRPQPSRPIHYLPGPLPSPHPEGLAYLPDSSNFFPGHLLMVLNLYLDVPPYVESRLEVLRLDGQVVQEILLPQPLRDNYLTAITLTTSGELLVGLYNELWTLDVAGNVLSEPITTPGPYVEGLERLPDGHFVVSEAATLRFFDADLNHLDEDRDAGLGLGFIGQYGIAWDSHTNQHLLATNLEATGDYLQPLMVASVAPSLKSATQLFEVPVQDRFRSWGPISYLPGEQLIAMGRVSYFGFRRPEIALYNRAGQIVELIDLRPFGDPKAFKYIPQTDQFVVTFYETPGPYNTHREHTLKILSRAGALVREIDLAPQGVTNIRSVSYFNPAHPSGGQFLIFGATTSDPYRAFVMDFEGNVVSQFNYLEELGLLRGADVDAITTGPLAGAFSVIDDIGYEMVIFKLNGGQ